MEAARIGATALAHHPNLFMRDLNMTFSSGCWTDD
jgi:hypothetical protein